MLFLLIIQGIFFILNVCAHEGLRWPAPRGGLGALDADMYFTSWVWNFDNNTQLKPFPCGGYREREPISLVSGGVYNATFMISSSKPTTKQVRHGGGYCEFGISYDGGLTHIPIARYYKTCPDIHFEWPFRIPTQLGLCDATAKCTLIWLWYAYNVPQVYHNCVDIIITNQQTSWFQAGMYRVNPASIGRYAPVGDGLADGEGPSQLDRSANLVMWA